MHCHRFVAPSPTQRVAVSGRSNAWYIQSSPSSSSSSSPVCFCHAVDVSLTSLHRHTHRLRPHLFSPFVVRTSTRSSAIRRLHSNWDDYPDTVVTEYNSMAGATSTASSTSTAKRRYGPPPKFYAVKAGRVPGVYQNWEDVRKQTEGFKNHVGV